MLQTKLRDWRYFTLPYGDGSFELAVFEAILSDVTFGALNAVIHAGGVVVEGFPLTMTREQVVENFDIFGASLAVVADEYLKEHP